MTLTSEKIPCKSVECVGVSIVAYVMNPNHDSRLHVDTSLLA